MTEHHDDIAAAIDRVAAARNSESDADWARQVAGRMFLEHVRPARAVEALQDVAEQLAAADEPAADLFGDPYEWAREQQEMWREAGVEHVESSPRTVRDLVIETLIIASVIAGLLLVYMVVTWSWGDPFTLSHLAAPLALAITSRAAEAAFASARAGRSQVFGVVAAVLAVGAGTALTVGVFAVGNTVTIGDRVVIGVLGSTLAYAALAWLVSRLWPEQPAKSTAPAPLHEDDWLHALGAALRTRGDMTDARVAQIVDDARAHARDAGRPLIEEFGSPRSYADRFATDHAVKRRRTAWLYTAAAVGVLTYNLLTVADGTAGIWGAAWLLVTAAMAIVEWRSVRRPRPSQAPASNRSSLA